MSQLETLKLKLDDNAQVQALKGWYIALPQRDRLVVKGVAAFVVLALVFLLILAPLIQANQSARNSLERNLEVYNLIASNAGQFAQSGKIGGPTGAIMPLVTQAARRDNIRLDRYEQDGQDVRIWSDRIEFDVFISWVESLQQRHGIRVSQITVNASDSPGRVDVRATLSGGA